MFWCLCNRGSIASFLPSHQPKCALPFFFIIRIQIEPTSHAACATQDRDQVAQILQRFQLRIAKEKLSEASPKAGPISVFQCYDHVRMNSRGEFVVSVLRISPLQPLAAVSMAVGWDAKSGPSESERCNGVAPVNSASTAVRASSNAP